MGADKFDKLDKMVRFGIKARSQKTVEHCLEEMESIAESEREMGRVDELRALYESKEEKYWHS